MDKNMNDDICGTYILSNATNQIIYVGMSTMLPERIQIHKDGLLEGYSKKHKCTKLVYYEIYSDRDSALFREKQIKKYSRFKKTQLIDSLNPHWIDLFDQLVLFASGY